MIEVYRLWKPPYATSAENLRLSRSMEKGKYRKTIEKDLLKSLRKNTCQRAWRECWLLLVFFWLDSMPFTSTSESKPSSFRRTSPSAKVYPRYVVSEAGLRRAPSQLLVKHTFANHQGESYQQNWGDKRAVDLSARKRRWSLEKNRLTPHLPNIMYQFTMAPCYSESSWMSDWRPWNVHCFHISSDLNQRHQQWKSTIHPIEIPL